MDILKSKSGLVSYMSEKSLLSKRLSPIFALILFLAASIVLGGCALTDDAIRVGVSLSDDAVRAGVSLSDDAVRAGVALSDDAVRAGGSLSDDAVRAIASNADEVAEVAVSNADEVAEVAAGSVDDSARVAKKTSSWTTIKDGLSDVDVSVSDLADIVEILNGINDLTELEDDSEIKAEIGKTYLSHSACAHCVALAKNIEWQLLLRESGLPGRVIAFNVNENLINALQVDYSVGFSAVENSTTIRNLGGEDSLYYFEFEPGQYILVSNLSNDLTLAEILEGENVSVSIAVFNRSDILRFEPAAILIENEDRNIKHSDAAIQAESTEGKPQVYLITRRSLE